MKKNIALSVSLFFLFALTVNANEPRTWTSADGEFKMEAKFIGVSDEGKTVVLRKIDGGISKVPLDELTKRDQKYVAENKDIPLQMPLGKWSKSQFQSIQTRSKGIAENQSEDILKKGAEQGNADSQVRLGLYYFGKGRQMDAMDWWETAAKQRNVQAASYLGILCFARRDYEAANWWTLLVADNGNAGAMEFLFEIDAAENGRNYLDREQKVREANILQATAQERKKIDDQIAKVRKEKAIREHQRKLWYAEQDEKKRRDLIEALQAEAIIRDADARRTAAIEAAKPRVVRHESEIKVTHETKK